MSQSLNDYVRFPIKALPYERKDEAIAKELIIKYSTGDIYIKSSDGTLMDVTNAIKEKIQNIQGEDIPIVIDGIGSIKLNTLILDMIYKIDNSIDSIELGNPKVYKEQDGTIDRSSIGLNSNGFVEVKGFEQGPKNGIFIKNDAGVAEFVTLAELAQISNDDPDQSDPNQNNGLKETVPSIEATNGKIYLRTNTKQKTTNPQQSTLYPILPPIIDDYSRIDWMLKLGNNVPTFKFDTNVIFEYKNYFQPSIGNNVYLYIFETYDNGATWLGRFIPFNKDLNTSDVDNVKSSYLSNNYYTKLQVDDLISWKVKN